MSRMRESSARDRRAVHPAHPLRHHAQRAQAARLLEGRVHDAQFRRVRDARLALAVDSPRALLESTPWLLGSLGTVALDSTILAQSRRYGGEDENGTEEEAEEESLLV